MPKRPKKFEDYSWSYQNKLLRLAHNDSSSDDNEQSTQSSASEEETNLDRFSIDSRIAGYNLYTSESETEEHDTSAEGQFEQDNIDSLVSNNTHQFQSNDCVTDTTDTDSDDSSLPSGSNSESIIQDNEPDEQERVNDDDEPLYEGARVTMFESMMTILSFQVRHNVSNTLLSDVLTLIELHCPSENNCITSLHKFKKYFCDMQMPISRHYYCARCSTSLESEESVCPACADDMKITYFIEMPLCSQVRTMFKRQGFYNDLQYRFTRDPQNDENFKDIYDGYAYKALFTNNRFLSDPANFSMTWYTDGIRIFKSSKFSIWPVYLIINELPFEERMKKENILLVALWFGEEKPAPNLFLEPLLQSSRELKHGINVDIADLGRSVEVKGIIICGTCDLPAKALFLNMKQYNGKFGCQKCKQEGLYLKQARVRVYPFEEFELRSDTETRLHAQRALATRKAVYGVKGPTILSSMVYKNMRAIAIDGMHCIFEGVVKSLLCFWFSPKHSEHPSSIVKYLDCVDERLHFFTPPSSIQRMPRSIKKHLPYWKAHELKAWFFYYSIPCVNDVMDEVYFNHYTLLILAITLLSRSNISHEDLDIASRALDEFVSTFEHLYYKRNMTNNLHQLLHLVENVRQFGPLWTTSCFPLEDLNGKLKNLVHGSKSAQLQIHSAVSRYLNLGTLKEERLEEGRPASMYCDKLDFKSGRLKRHFVKESIHIVGKCKQVLHLRQDLKRTLERSGINGAKFYSYNKLLKKKALYSSTDIQHNKRTNSTYARYSEVGSTRIGRIRCFVRVANCLCRALCTCDAENYAILRPCLTENNFSTCIDNTSLSMVHTIGNFENQDKAVRIENLQSVCFYLKVHDTAQAYVIEPVNSVEFE